MAISAGKGNRLVKKLMQSGYLQAHEINMGGRGGSVKYLELTEKGYDAIGVKPEQGIGRGAGFEHGFWQYHISEQAKDLPGIQNVMIEGRAMDKFIDVLIETKTERIAIEIAMNPEHEKINAIKDIASGCAKVIIGCNVKSTLEAVSAMILDSNDMQKEKIVICRIQEIVVRLKEYLQTKGVE